MVDVLEKESYLITIPKIEFYGEDLNTHKPVMEHYREDQLVRFIGDMLSWRLDPTSDTDAETLFELIETTYEVAESEKDIPLVSETDKLELLFKHFSGIQSSLGYLIPKDNRELDYTSTEVTEGDDVVYLTFSRFKEYE